ncbi:hypothetical protein BDW22DRAFT_847207 [Trametopsis cervina]|nr:hypothetical protein BDW22DRAFT_847207 [Trametopsis cervina]
MSDRAPSQAEEAGSSRSRSGAASVEAEPVAAAEYDARSASVADVASMNADPTIPIQAANTSASSLSYVSVPGPQQFEPVEALLVTSPVADGGTSAPTESVAAVLISPVNTSRQSIPLGAQVVPITGSPVASSAGHAASVRSAPPVESAYIGSPSGPASSVGHVSVSQQPISVIQAVPPPALPSAGSSSTLPSAAVSVSGTPPQPAEASSSAQRVILIPTTTVYSMPPQSSQQSFPEAAPPPPPKTYAHSGTSAPTGAHPQQFYAPSAPNISIGSGMDIANGSTNVAPPAHSPRERPPSLTMPGTYMPEPQPSLPIHMQPHQQPRHERRLSLTWDPNTYSRHSHSSLNRGPPLSPPHTTALTNIDSGRYPQSPTQEQIEARLGGETDYFAQSPGVQPPQPALSRHSSSRRSYGGRDRPANYYDQPPVPSQQQRQPTPNARGDDDQQPDYSLGDGVSVSFVPID